MRPPAIVADPFPDRVHRCAVHGCRMRPAAGGGLRCPLERPYSGDDATAIWKETEDAT